MEVQEDLDNIIKYLSQIQFFYIINPVNTKHLSFKQLIQPAQECCMTEITLARPTIEPWTFK